MGLIPELESSHGEGNGNPLQSSCLGNPMDRGGWWATVLGATKSQTRLSAHTHTHTPFSIENPKKENENLEGIQIIEHGQ